LRHGDEHFVRHHPFTLPKCSAGLKTVTDGVTVMPEQFVQFEVQGQRIYGMLHLPDVAAKNSGTKVPAVAMCHGFTGNRIEAHRLFVKAARYFAANGFAVLRFDFRGSGESEGDFEQVTVSDEIADALAALAFVRRQSVVDENRIGLIGLRRGVCRRARPTGESVGAVGSRRRFAGSVHDPLGRHHQGTNASPRLLGYGRLENQQSLLRRRLAH
jgi:fermentation-respiration switch protein FrsA (DUF1100 family)